MDKMSCVIIKRDEMEREFNQLTKKYNSIREELNSLTESEKPDKQASSYIICYKIVGKMELIKELLSEKDNTVDFTPDIQIS